MHSFCYDGVVGPEGPRPLGDRRFGSVGWSPRDVWGERLRQLGVLASHQRKLPQTVEHQVQRFLDFKEMQVRGGVLKARTWGTLAERLPIFTDWIKPGTHVSTINGTTITEFYKWLYSSPGDTNEGKASSLPLASGFGGHGGRTMSNWRACRRTLTRVSSCS